MVQTWHHNRSQSPEVFSPTSFLRPILIAHRFYQIFKHFSMAQQFSILRIEVVHYAFNVLIGRHRGLELLVRLQLTLLAEYVLTHFDDG